MTERGGLASRADVPARYRWDLADICRDWDEWAGTLAELETAIGAFAARQGTLASGQDALLEAFRAMDRMGALGYRVWYYASLRYDEDQRDNEMAARRQQVQILFARQQQAAAWFNPELLAVPLGTIQAWMTAHAELGTYRFAVESLFHQQAHVLDERGERLLSYAARAGAAPHESYAAMTTADMRFPSVRLAGGEEVTLSYARYRALLETSRDAGDRLTAYRAFHETYATHRNTYAAIYDGVLQRDWFEARARGYDSTLDAALHGDNIPASVVETLIRVTREQVEPLRRYHRLRRRVLGLETYRLSDVFVPLVDHDRRYPYDEVGAWIVDAAAPLGSDYQARVRRALEGRWIDVYENAGKRSGAYSAPVYGAHPYMLLNYNETLDSVFTLAHEMGHSMHTLLSHESQPFVYAGYTIFVAEVPSTLSEALFLDLMLERADDARQRVLLLQHAIDAIAGTFYTQVMFADFELQAHRLVEQDRPVTAEVLCDLYGRLLGEYYGDAIDVEAVSTITWARIPHLFGSPFYVYQYATCFASTARLMQDLRSADPGVRADGVARYLALLRAGGSGYPMDLLRASGIDLREDATVRAVASELDALVTTLEADLGQA